MVSIEDFDKKKCCGCRTCEQVCPKNAIKFIENKEGFLEPVVEEKQCINCGICVKKCPQINYSMINQDSRIVYAANNKDNSKKMSSSSGGIFFEIAESFILNNGIVYGCIFNSDMEAIHIGTTDIQELKKMQGSKYVQSDTKHTFSEVKSNLSDGKNVLYCGTPCQIAGLKSFLGRDYENLYTIDLVCHGVPSPKLFKKYIENLEDRFKDRVINYNFRNKEKSGWGLMASVDFENVKRKYIDFRLDPYYKSFIEAKTYRESCYECKYANTHRIGDITLLDFWGIEKFHPDFYDESGNSAIIINSDKGNRVFENIKNNFNYIETEMDNIISNNKNLISPSVRLNERDSLYEDIDRKGFKDFCRENLGFRMNIIVIIKQKIPKVIKRKLKRIIRCN